MGSTPDQSITGTPLLATKLYIPQRRTGLVDRPHLVKRLDQGTERKLTLISAPAGFGKTTLLVEWLASSTSSGCPVAWVSLDQGDNDPVRFWTYIIAAVQTIHPGTGANAHSLLQSPQPPPIEALVTTVINEIAAIAGNIILVLDDLHLLDSEPVRGSLSLFVDHLPPQLHLVIASRADPPLPLARLRGRGDLIELRADDLRFTAHEAAAFLNEMMGLDVSAADVAALETRTEGWIAGLQLAAISMQGHQDAARFIQSFTGSHHFVMDYLVGEVLDVQSASVQTFLLRTSILDRLCGSLCDAVLPDSSVPGQEVLEYLEHANLFLVPLDNERRWYRYHHLFAELLRQRLHQGDAFSPASTEGDVTELHLRASEWYEAHGLAIEAFHHAAAANDIDRTARLIGGKGIPLHFRGAVTAIVSWLESLPATVLDAKPWLWWRYGSLLLVIGQTTGVEEKLRAAEDALEGIQGDDQTQNLVGDIAAARAVLALTQYQPETMLAQSRRALEYLHPDNLSSRANANWTLGYAYILQRDHAAASRAFTDAISLSQMAGDTFTTILATVGLGQVLEAKNQLYLADETYRRVLRLAGDQPLHIISEAHLGLARIWYEWNDLDTAEQHVRQSHDLARQYDSAVDRFLASEVLLGRLTLARGDVTGAADMLARSSRSARQQNFTHRTPEIVAAQVLTLLQQGQLAAATRLVQSHDLPLSQARIYLAQDSPSAALATLDPFRQQAEARGWQDEQLKALVLQALAHQARGEMNMARQLLGDALALAEPGGFIRLFVDEGEPMHNLLRHAAAEGIVTSYTRRLLSAFGEPTRPVSTSHQPAAADLPEPLTPRETEVLQHIAAGMRNHEIAVQLYISVSTVKRHIANAYGKLGVGHRTEAIARAKELGLL